MVNELRRPAPDRPWHQKLRDLRPGAAAGRPTEAASGQSQPDQPVTPPRLGVVGSGVPADGLAGIEGGAAWTGDERHGWVWLALTAVGAAALALGVLWGWQAWSERSDPPIDELLPMLVVDDGGTRQPDEGDKDVVEGATGASTSAEAHPDESAVEAAPSESRSAPPVPEEVEPEEPPDEVLFIVHISGAVAQPGIVEVPAGARIFEAVDLAGGAIDTADLARVNLAAPLVDGERVHIPEIGEDDPPEIIPTDRPAPGSTAGGSTASSAESTADPIAAIVDINRASADELEVLPGVGPTIAAAIVETRDARGPFRSVDELIEVPGIGQAKLDELRPHVWVRPA